MALEDTLGQAADAAATVSHGLEDQGDLEVAEGRLEIIQKDEALRTMLEIGKAAGRVQSAQIFGHVADSIQVSQLRQLKSMHKQAGLSWEQTCNMIGISRRTAERYLSFANELGDDFFGHCAQIGLSVRTMEAARQLPEPVRQALAQGEVVDLETVSKEALTQVIRDLASEHAREKNELEQTLAAERKTGKKTLDKAAELTDQVKSLAAELEAQKEGLPAEDKKALEQLRQVEFSVVAHLVRIKNTLELGDRDPGFIARLMGSLSLIENLAALTAKVVAARVDGQEMDEEAYATAAAGAQADNLDNAAFDQRAAYPGI
ncbi:MAG: hypothetical protein LDL07_06225 [Desulfarculus sp.]|nr:hypothetical protein [Desulfarculus sp.]